MPNTVKLLPHQIKSLEYIIARCKTQHGLILNHYMGTGKTITGLVFLQNFPKSKKVIIHPKGLDSVWKSEATRLNIPKDSITYINFGELMNFEKYAEIIKDSVCVVDEAHNIYDIRYALSGAPKLKPKFGEKKQEEKNKELEIKPKLIEFLDIMYSTKKILLLSGTLLKDADIYDISWLINIAAAKKKAILPFNYQEFYLKYYKYTPDLKIWNQLVRPLLILNPFNLLPNNVRKDLPLDEDSILGFIFTLLTTKAFSEIMSRQTILPSINSTKGVFDINRYKEIFSKIISYSSEYKLILYFLSFTLLLKGAQLTVEYAKTYIDETYNYDALDVKKFIESGAGKYISRFDYRTLTDRKDYPTVKEKIITVPYTKDQLVLLMRLINTPEMLTSEELVILELNNNIREAELFRTMEIKESVFIDKARIIGNVSDNPKKFTGILKNYISSSRSSTVVYSNFYHSGVLLFSEFLKQNKVPHIILDHFLSDDEKTKAIKDFEDGKVTMLLLHPDFFEGISIKGVKNLHVLEPIADSDKREQLYARVVRYKSHAHLAKSKRHVDIYQWGCTLFYDFNKILHLKVYTKTWFESFNVYKSVLSLIRNFTNFLSPDDRILQYYTKSKNFTETFNKTMKEVSIDKTKIPLTCCIWTPDSSCTDKSLEKCDT